MSKRAGTVVTLDDLVEAIGVDAARYALVRYSVDTTDRHRPRRCGPRRTNDNPVYYVQYAHARTCRAARATRPSSASTAGRRRPDAARPTRRRATLLARARRSSRGSSPAAAELREPHRVARYLEDTRGDLPPVLRRLPGAAAGRRGADRPAPRPAAAGRGDPHGARQRPRPARRLRAGADVSAHAAHEAGARTPTRSHHAGPAVAARAAPTPTRSSRMLWSRDRVAGDDGVARASAACR